MNLTELKNVVIVGRPNVGKSTLFNRLAGKRIAIETETAGTTRDRLFAEIDWQGDRFNLIDIAGVETKAKNAIDRQMQQNINDSIDIADLIIFLTDWTDQNNDNDKVVARLLRKIDKPVLLVVNKADNVDRQKNVDKFIRLGNYPIVPVSAISGSNTGDLLDRIVLELKKIKKTDNKKQANKKADIDLSIIGRPNVGKSTLLNSIIGAKRAIVSDIAGTTRDTISVNFLHNGKNILISDTAGIRRPGKIEHSSIESYSLLRTYDALKKSDVAILVIDATEGLVALDMNILGKAKEWGKGVVLAVNKIDQITDPEFVGRTIFELKQKLNFAPWLPVVFISAQNLENLKPLLNCVVASAESRQKIISENETMTILSEAKQLNPQLESIKSFKQIKTAPQVFKITYKGKKAPHLSQVRYLENKLRDTYPLNGAPLFVDVD